jgi:L-seryl-tRNA(Ser) seleniumtransferase
MGQEPDKRATARTSDVQSRTRTAETSAFRALPSISDLLADPTIIAAAAGLAPAYRTAIVRAVVDHARTTLRAGGEVPEPETIRNAVRLRLQQVMGARHVPLINATGVILHTNLGRAPVSAAAAAAMRDVAAAYVPLEMELATGDRGGRMAELRTLFRLLTGCEDALVVNNNAAATVLVLAATVAPGRDAVILSRSEAVEIGGAFRIPDILRQSGAALVDVGTTNRTYRRDYEAAIDERTAALLKVHTSNFRLTGFVEQTPAADLVPLANARGIPVIDDLGSGALVDTTAFGLAAEPTLQGSVRAGAHLTTASGDKLLGGPQAGIILGTKEWVQRCAAHPLARAFRADKATLAGLAATLRHYLRDEHLSEIPVWRMIAATPPDLAARCACWRTNLTALHIPVDVYQSAATIGGGSLPGETLPSSALAITEQVARGAGLSVDALARQLRVGTHPVIGRIDAGRLLLDARTVQPDEDDALITALKAAWEALTTRA